MNQTYRSLTSFVQQVRRVLYRRRVLQGVVSLLTVLLAVLLLGMGVRFLVPFIPWLAPLYSLFTLLVLVLLGKYVIWPGCRPVSRQRALTAIEATYPELHDDLTNAVQLDLDTLERDNPRGVALELVRALHHHTARRLSAYSVKTIAQYQPIKGTGWCSYVLVATLAVGVLAPGIFGDVFHILGRPWDYLPPREMHIAITPTQAVIAQGMNVEVQARVSGRLPRTMQLQVKRRGETPKTYSMEALESGVFRYTFLKVQSSLTFQAMAGGFESPQGTLEVVPSPAIGQMVLRYTFPDYTGLATRLQEGGGDIQALPGTRIHLQLQANVPLIRGVLRFLNGREVPLEVNGQELQGEMLVMQPDAYMIEVEDTHGLRNPQPPRYTVQVTPDQVPAVRILEPQDNAEVDETTALTVRYEVSDDFGLQDAVLVYRGTEGTERRIPLHSGRFPHHQSEETFSWDMHQWPLPDSDTVQVHIEVADNDTISGPKKGVSPTVTLLVRSRQREHEQLENMQEEIAEALLDLLADHLELSAQVKEWRERASAEGTAPHAEALARAQEQQQQGSERAAAISQKLDEALAQVQDDPYSTYETFASLQAMQRNLSHVQNALLPPLQQSLQNLTPATASPQSMADTDQRLDETVREMERLATLSEQVTQGEKMQDLMRLGTKLTEQQNALLAALDNVPQDFQGGDIPADLQRMLDTLQALMQEMMQAIAQLPTAGTDEFLNQQLNALPLSDMQQQLQQLRDKLAAGDMEGARQLAAEMLKNLSSMMAAMQNMQQQAQGGPLDAMSQQLQASTNQLTELIERQERVLDHTQGIDQETVQALNTAQQRAFDSAQEQLSQELNKMSRLVTELARQGRQHPELAAQFEDLQQQFMAQLQTARSHLGSRDVPQVTAALEEMGQQLSWMQQRLRQMAHPDATMQQQMTRARQHLQNAHKMLQNLPQDRQALLTPTQKTQLGELAEQQDGVQHDTQTLHQEFRQLLPLMPFLPSELGQNLEEALPFMGQARQELQARQSQSAIPPEQEALDRLRNAQNALQQAMQAMAQRGQMAGMSMPMLRQAGRFPMPGMMSQPGNDEQQDGNAGVSVRNFQLPDKEAYKVPRMFREDIMEALREGYPERYKELIERYYRDIVR